MLLWITIWFTWCCWSVAGDSVWWQTSCADVLIAESLRPLSEARGAWSNTWLLTRREGQWSYDYYIRCAKGMDLYLSGYYREIKEEFYDMCCDKACSNFILCDKIINKIIIKKIKPPHQQIKLNILSNQFLWGEAMMQKSNYVQC